MKYAVLDAGNVVTNVIEADPDTVNSIYPSAIPWQAPGDIGSTWDGSSFSLPHPSPVVGPRTISVLQFEERFTAPERVTIRTSTDPYVADFLGLLTVAPSVDLDNATVIQGVQYLEQVSKILAAGRSAEILA